MRAIKKLKILFLITITIFSFGLFDRIASAASDDVIVVVVPATPTGLSATPESCGYINITWNASPGATSYTLTDNWGTIYTGSSNSFRQAVTAGSAHTYRVLSSNAYGTSAYSAPVGAVGPSACVAYYSVTTSLTVGGSINPTSNNSVASGSTTSFSITAYPGYALDTASGCGGYLSGSTYITGAINANCTVYVTFRVQPPSGSISASNCTIPAGSNSCNSSLSWNTSNPISTSAVTTPTNITVANANSGSTTYPVYYGSRTFYLYNNGILLAQTPVSSSCAANTTWNGSICAINTFSLTVNKAGTGSGTVGGAGTYNYGTTATATATASTGSTFSGWSGDCNASGQATMTTNRTCVATFTLNSYNITYSITGSGSVSPSSCIYGQTVTPTCSPSAGYVVSSCPASFTCGTVNSKAATFSLMTGTLTSSASSCAIASGASSCTVNLTWATTNPIGTSAVTASGMTNVNGNSGGPTAFTVPYGGRTFYLYNNGILLAQTPVSSSCAANTTWNGSICAINTFSLTVNKAGTGSGTVGGAGTYNYGTTATATATASTGSTFSGWSGDCTGIGSCALEMTSAKSVTATFSAVTASVVASPTSFSTTPSTNISFSYTPSTSLGSTECRLLNNASSPLTSFQASSPIVYASPSAAGSYGYYIQCRNTVHTTILASSALVTVNVITVSVSASPSTYNVAPGSNVSFSYSASTNSGTTECLLLDNALAQKTSYQTTSPINFTIPNSIDLYGYYIRCRNTATPTALATSGLINVNTTCSTGTSWNGTSCVPPSGSISSTPCQIQAEENSCQTSLTWNVLYAIGPTAVTTTPGNTELYTGANSGSGQEATVPYNSRTFYLYNYSQLLSQTTANAVCTTDTVWSVVENRCKATTGTLDVGGCTIGQGESTCQVQLDWTTTNPTTISQLRKNSTSGDIVRSANNGSELHSVSQGITNFFLLHGGVTLKTAASTAVCAPSTQWNSSTCQLLAPEIENFYSASSTIFNGRSTTLHWDSNASLVNSCVVTAPSYNSGILGPSSEEGGLVITPTTTTTYTLTCTRGSYSDVDTLVVKVLNMVIKEQ